MKVEQHEKRKYKNAYAKHFLKLTSSSYIYTHRNALQATCKAYRLSFPCCLHYVGVYEDCLGRTRIFWMQIQEKTLFGINYTMFWSCKKLLMANIKCIWELEVRNCKPQEFKNCIFSQNIISIFQRFNFSFINVSYFIHDRNHWFLIISTVIFGRQSYF